MPLEAATDSAYQAEGSAPADDPDFARLEFALHWCAEGRWPWRCIGWSAGLHSCFILTSTLAGLLVAHDALPAPAKDVVSVMFAPAPSAPPPPSAEPAPGPRSLPPLSAGPKVPDVAVDLRTMRLTFAPDVSNQLPKVIQSQHGMLALLDKDDAGIARYLIEPPAWEAHEGIVDISPKLRILMDPPEKWPVFLDVAQRYGINLARYRASAVFDIAYRRCLQDAIRSRAAGGANSGRVVTARLAFAADHPCGIEVLEVSLAADPPGTR